MVQYVRLVISTSTILFSLRNMYAAFSYGHFSKMSQAMFLFAPAYVLKTGTKPLYTISRLTFFKNDVCLFFLLGELTDCRSFCTVEIANVSCFLLLFLWNNLFPADDAVWFVKSLISYQIFINICPFKIYSTT